MKLDTRIKLSGALVTVERSASFSIGLGWLLGGLIALPSRLAEADRRDQAEGRAHDFTKAHGAARR